MDSFVNNLKFRAIDICKESKEFEYCGFERVGGYHIPMENPIDVWTGLIDKEKKDIYENDILLYDDGRIVRVIWNENCAMFDSIGLNIVGVSRPLSDRPNLLAKVIGSTHTEFVLQSPIEEFNKESIVTKQIYGRADREQTQNILDDTHENRQKFFESFDLNPEYIGIIGWEIPMKTLVGPVQCIKWIAFGKSYLFSQILNTDPLWEEFGRRLCSSIEPNSRIIFRDNRPSKRIRELCNEPGVYTMDGIIKYLDEQFRKGTLHG